MWFIRTWFFWLVDVVPAKAESVAEAKQMAIGGPITWLGKKFLSDFGNWTEDDTDQFASLMNWRARLFFHSTQRIRERIGRWKKIHETTGKQPGDFTQEEQLKVVADLEPSWFEKAVIDRGSFYCMLYVVVISIAIISLDYSMR